MNLNNASVFYNLFAPKGTNLNLVSIERTKSYDRPGIEEGLLRLLSPLGGIEAFVKPGERVLLKPNMLAAKWPEAAVTTHPEVLRAVIMLVQSAGGVALVGDSPGIGGFIKVAEKTGMLAVVKETGAELIEFTEAIDVAGTGSFKRLELAKPYVEADKLINLPKLKTHEMMTMTCAVKNLFGAVVGAAKAGWHLKAGADRELFAKMLVELYLLRKPELNIVDAVVAMEGNGPGSGDPCAVNLLLASDNAVALDVIAAEILGIPGELLYLEKAARKLGVEGADRSKINTAGLPVEEAKVTEFRLPHLSDVQFGLPRFLKSSLKHYLTSRPAQIAGKCTGCGICQQACPPQAIHMKGKALHFEYDACIRCFCCRELCPEAALDVVEGELLRIIKKFK